MKGLPSTLENKLQTVLLTRQQKSLLRQKTPTEQAGTPYVHYEGQKYLSFSSNDYLGLSQHPQVIAASHEALKKYGVGSGSAYLVTGFSPAHMELEEQLAEFLNYPRVLLFSSGYLANLGTIAALLSKDDALFADKLNHASLLDSCLSSSALLKRYPHRNLETLERYCAKITSGIKLIATEGLFGMDGSLAPLDKIALLAKQYQSTLYVDDAHGIGVLGSNGRGTIEHFSLTVNEVPILMGTLGKAFGCYGAFVASNDLIIDGLTQLARSYLYTTALPPCIAASALTSLQISQTESWRRQRLRQLITYFRECTRQLQIPVLDSCSPIQPILLGSNEKALAVSTTLLSKGLLIKAIRPPTVPPGTARLRVTITAEHNESHLNHLLEVLADAIKPT